MTEPTLNELREAAKRVVTRRHHESEEGVLALAFLELTDPTPLTAEHCRETGGVESNGWFMFRNGFTAEVPVSVEGGDVYLGNATRGQLRLALMMESSDGE